MTSLIYSLFFVKINLGPGDFPLTLVAAGPQKRFFDLATILFQSAVQKYKNVAVQKEACI